MGYSSRRIHLESLSYQLKTGNWRVQLTHEVQNWTMIDWICCLTHWVTFALRHLVECLRICFILPTVQVAANGVLGNGIFSLAYYRPLIQNEHCLDAAVYICIIVEHIHLFMTTGYRPLMATSIRIMHHVTELQSSQIGFLNSLYFNGLHIHQTSVQPRFGGSDNSCQYGWYGSKIISTVSTNEGKFKGKKRAQDKVPSLYMFPW